MSSHTKFSNAPWEQSVPLRSDRIIKKTNTMRADKEIQEITLPKNKVPPPPTVDEELRLLCNTSFPSQWALSIITMLVDNMIIDIDCLSKCSCQELQEIGIRLGAAKILTDGASELVKKKKQEELNKEPLFKDVSDSSCASPAVSEDSIANSEKMHYPMAMKALSPNAAPFVASSPTGTIMGGTPTATTPPTPVTEELGAPADEELCSLAPDDKFSPIIPFNTYELRKEQFQNMRPLCNNVKNNWQCIHFNRGTCNFYHPKDDKELKDYQEWETFRFLKEEQRNSKDLPTSQSTSSEPKFQCYGVCTRCADGEYCESGYAHTPEDVADYAVCKFKDTCCHVRKWKDGKFRRTNAVTCMRYHGKETKEDLFERIQKNIKWTKWSSTS